MLDALENPIHFLQQLPYDVKTQVSDRTRFDEDYSRVSVMFGKRKFDSSQYSKCLIIGRFLLFSTQVKISHDLLSREKHTLGSLGCLQCGAVPQAAPSHCIMITFLPTIDRAII